ncbi:MAG: GNAT family protein [Planctomycetota bacterium]
MSVPSDKNASVDPDSQAGLDFAPPDPLEFEIVTPRLVIRPYRLDDIDAVFDAVNHNREHLLPWLPWAKKDHHTRAQTAAFLAKNVVDRESPQRIFGRGLDVAVCDRHSGAFIGGTGLHDLRRDSASCEIGYWIVRDRCREGICSEAVAHWLSWLFTPQQQGGFGLRRARIFCDKPNAASAGVPTKLGLRLEVEMRDEAFIEGVGLVDRLGWGVLASEWDCERHAVFARD